jgi:DNA polymerase-3 subunit gamma/tau
VGISKNAVKLESAGMSGTIHIAQLRKAAWWSRLAPLGRGKLLIIENADRMEEGARNSLLKLLEEPPERLRVTLCTPRQGSLPSTILSRLRVYRFGGRSGAVETEVIRRVFRDSAGDLKIGAYLDSFLPVSVDTLEDTAAFFAASAAYRAVLLSKKRSPGDRPPEEAVLLGKFCAPRAEAAGFGRPLEDPLRVIELVLEKTEKFEIRSLFSRFLRCLLAQVSKSLEGPPGSPLPGAAPPGGPTPGYYELWKKCSDWTETAVGVYNLRPAQALEKLFNDLSRGMAEL